MPRAVRALLSGGDRRSLASSRQALRLVHSAPERVGTLATLAGDKDCLRSMRALDLLARFAHSHPRWVAPYRRLLLGSLADG